jgi:isopropylmalate/homocitrate/citramalate synthase
MKYLTKFNEYTTEHLKAIDEISNYVDNCFIDLKDSNNYFGESVFMNTSGIVDYIITTHLKKIEFILDGIERVDNYKLKELFRH